MKKKYKKRYSKDEWCSRALDILSREGHTLLRIEQISKSLGVSKGSFYWHFKDRNDFVISIAKYWATYSTSLVIEEVDQVHGDAKERLLAIMNVVFREDLGRYDLIMRAWAAKEPRVAVILKRVDAQRMAYVRSIFSEMGFRGPQLDIRTRAFVCYMAGEHVLSLKETREEQLRQLKIKQWK